MFSYIFAMLCVVWLPFLQIQRREKHQWRSVTKLQALARNFIKSNVPPWVLFRFFKLYKCYQIAQSVSFVNPF